MFVVHSIYLVIILEFSAIKVPRLDATALACGACQRTSPVTIDASRHFFLVPTKLNRHIARTQAKSASLCTKAL